MKYFTLTVAILVLWAAAMVTSAPPPQHDPAPPAEEDYDLGPVADEVIPEEVTTARPARRRLPASRSKATGTAKAERPLAAERPAATTTTTTTERPAKRRPASTTSGSGSRTTSTTPKPGEEEPPASTYRRPKFPPRHLPGPTQRPTTTEPAPDAGLDAPVDALPAEGEIAEGPLLEEELIDVPARR